ncbi:MAG: serine hydrolase domain-containing protein [Maribacter sp.]
MKSFITYFKNLFTSQREELDKTQTLGIKKADGVLNSLIEEKKIPGLAITVLNKGELLFQKGYGYADLKDKKKINPKRTVFRVASVSKNIAATALGQMVKDGIMDLDASLYQYVPYFPKKKYDFTIRQLAAHTAGIRGYRGKEYGLNESYSIKDGLRIFKDDALLFKPGTNYHYNSFNWVLISLAMQEASGIPFEAYVQEKVLKPLDLQNTFPEFIEDSSRLALKRDNELATFYSRKRIGFRKAIPVNNQYKLASGGYVSTSDDIAKFGQAYLNNEVLDKTVVTEFLTSENINGKPTYYGLGWQVSIDAKGRAFYGHVGNGVGGYSNLFIYPKEQLVFSILINCTNPRIQDILDNSIDIIISNS